MWWVFQKSICTRPFIKVEKLKGVLRNIARFLGRFMMSYFSWVNANALR
ncbi:hypothetical protein FUAX_06600 [Fulvitalea axinellae]|uniref:Transposase DDE domain-containing protein n=1 Tax=Fulvitalea axinellae TaxID=1182444 RepID=A0AAU9CXB8_9BACT|nr:hypothetical protein FUAX_06600 [Fulvitalea axinellae]